MAKSIYIERRPGEPVSQLIERALLEPTMTPDQRESLQNEIGTRSAFDDCTKGIYVMQLDEPTL